MNRMTMTILLLLGTAVLAVSTAERGAAAPGADDPRESASYDRGRDALDEGEWQRAVEAFDAAAKLNGRRADGALYWKAYALNKLGRRPEALSTIEVLRSAHPDSRWIDDAKALEVEIRQASGRPMPPEAESDEELKLIALNGLLNMDPERAVPMLEKFIQSGNAPRLKEQALFVLLQTGSPRARDLVTKIARGQSNAELQRKAIEYLGLFGDVESRRLLKEIYGGTADREVKRSILQAYMTSGDQESLMAAARGEQDVELRRAAIQFLGAQGARDELWRLYQAEADMATRSDILQSLAISGDSARLLEVARSEKDPQLRRSAIQGLGICGSESTTADLMGLYRAEKDRDVKRAVLDALLMQGDVKTLIDLARRESDPEMRKEAVGRLSTMDSKEATDFLLELLKE